jgi:hypothetical protein
MQTANSPLNFTHSNTAEDREEKGAKSLSWKHGASQVQTAPTPLPGGAQPLKSGLSAI